MELDLVEIKIPRRTGKAVVKNHAKYDENGKVLMPIKKGKKTSLETIEAVKEILAKKENLKTDKKAPKIIVERLIEEFKGTFVSDTDRAGFVNFRYPGSKKIIFYATNRSYGIAISTRDDLAKSGWRTDRITTANDLKTFVESIKMQEQNHQRFAGAFIPYYHCPIENCTYQTQSKTEMTTHIVTHSSKEERHEP